MSKHRHTHTRITRDNNDDDDENFYKLTTKYLMRGFQMCVELTRFRFHRNSRISKIYKKD